MPPAWKWCSGSAVWGVTGRRCPTPSTTCRRAPLECQHPPPPPRPPLPAAPAWAAPGAGGAPGLAARWPDALAIEEGGARDLLERATLAAAAARDEDALATADASRADRAALAARRVLASDLVGRLGPALGALP